MPHNKSFRIYRIYQDSLLLINHIFHCFLDVFHDYTEYFSLPLFKEADFLIPVKDNSMAPHYKGGDIIACKTLSCKSLFFQWNKVYLSLTPQGALIKRIYPGEDEQHVMLVSDNTDYPPFQLDHSLISNVALVLGSLSVE